MKTIRFLAMTLTLFLTVAASMPSDSEEKGQDIARQADLADQGFEDSQVELTMILRNKRGQESKRFMTNRTLELQSDGDKSLIIFNSPGDVKGTATLTFTHKEGADDQWLYLPAIKRVKRISSDNKSGPFMGSEFAYEDLSSQEVEKYTYNFLGEEIFGGETTLKVERFPIDSKSGYARQVVWYNPNQGYRLEKVEFFDRKNAHLKTLTYRNYELYANKHWRAGEMLMVNHQTNKETQLIFAGYAFKNGFSDADFSINSLKRARS